MVLAAKNDFIHKISTLDQQEEAQPEVTSCLLLSALTFSFSFFLSNITFKLSNWAGWSNINQDSLTASPVSHRRRFQNFDRHFCPAWKQTEQHRREVCFCARYSVFPFPSYLATHFSILYFYFLINLRTASSTIDQLVDNLSSLFLSRLVSHPSCKRSGCDEILKVVPSGALS